MPKSKRSVKVDLTKTKQRGLEGKKNLVREIQGCCDKYEHLFVFSVNDMRNAKLKDVRQQWKHSRFFIGKNKVMTIALGRTPEAEYKPNLQKVARLIAGQKGLLFSDQPIDEVIKWFSCYTAGDFARSGHIATEDVTLPEGPLMQFAQSQESYLRQLGLPTTLKKGVIHLLNDYLVCKEGDVLSPETARVLKLLGYEMAEFQLKIECVWSQDGSFEAFASESLENGDGQPPKKKRKMDTMDIEELDKSEDEDMMVDEGSEEEDIPQLVAEKNGIEDNDVIEVLDQKLPEKFAVENEKETIENESANGVSETEAAEEKIDAEITEVTKESVVGDIQKSDCEITEDTAEEKIDAEITEVTKESVVGDIQKSVCEIAEDTAEEKIDAEITEVTKESVVEEIQKSDCEITEDKTIDIETILKMTEKKIEVNAPKSPPKFSPKLTRSKAKEDTNEKDVDNKTVQKTRKSRAMVDKVNNEIAETKNFDTKEHVETETKKVQKESAVEDVDKEAVLKMTKKKIAEASPRLPRKVSPKLTRSRAKATNKKVVTPDEKLLRSARKSTKRKA